MTYFPFSPKNFSCRPLRARTLQWRRTLNNRRRKTSRTLLHHTCLARTCQESCQMYSTLCLILQRPLQSASRFEPGNTITPNFILPAIIRLLGILFHPECVFFNIWICKQFVADFINFFFKFWQLASFVSISINLPTLTSSMFCTHFQGIADRFPCGSRFLL